MKSVTVPEGVEEIGDYAFAQIKLRSIKIPKSVVKIGETLCSDYGGSSGTLQIYYAGTEEEWNKTGYGMSNPEVHFNSK